MEKQGYVYMLASARNGTLYVGVTSHLVQRIWQHKQKLIKGFANTYNVTLLVWYEVHSEITQAIARERRIKGWKRAWKIEAIEASNPQWRDLYDDICR